jgi:dihydroneopterin aldolase/2-amino-4-hydroxy-6-hydroxymethyldihydropteridine diphosphokinase
METVVLGFGSNIGNRRNNIENAVKEISLTPGFALLARSFFYETEPWGYKKQNKFLNACAVYLCRLSPAELLKCIKSLERKIGRLKRGKWQAREIDIDVLFYGSKIVKAGNLIIPHPFIQERNFVLKPLVELMPGFIHPKIKKSIHYIYSHSKDDCKVNLYNER